MFHRGGILGIVFVRMVLRAVAGVGSSIQSFGLSIPNLCNLHRNCPQMVAG